MLKEYCANALAVHRDHVPKYLIFFVTSRCNAKCSFCHYRKQIDDQSRKAGELSVEEIDRIAAGYGKISKLSFSGGEPFLRDGLPEIIEAFIRNCDPRIIDIPTNGSMPERIRDTVAEIMLRLGDRVLDVQLSIDGSEEIHNELRGIPDLFNKVLKTYAALAELRDQYPNLKLKMNLVYVPENQHATEALAVRFEERYDFDRFQITYPHGESIKERITERLNFEQFYQLSREIQRHYRLRSRSDLHSLIFRAIKMIRDDILKKEHVYLNDLGAICRAGERILVLDEIGNVYPCEPLWESVGNLRDAGYDIKRILGGPAMAAFRDKHLGRGKCSCTWGCVALEKVVYSPSLYPRLLANLCYLLVRGGRGFGNRRQRDV